MLRKILSVLINNVLVFVLGLVYTVISARMLGPGLRGILVVAVLVPTWIAVLSLLGLPQSLVYNLSRRDQSPDSLDEAIAISIRYLAVAMVVALLFYFAMARSPVLRGLPVPLQLWSLALCGGLLAEGVVLSILAGLQDFPWRNATALIRPLLVALALAAGWLSKTQLSPVLIVQVMTAAALLGFMVGCTYVAIAFRPSVGVRIPADWLQNYGWYGLKVYSATFAQAVNYRLDTLIVNAQLGSREVGLYSAGVGAAELLLFVPISVAFVFYPRITAAPDETRDRTTLITLGASLYIVIVGACLLTAALPWLLPVIFGRAFSSAVIAAQWLMPGMAALTVVRILSYACAGVGRPEYATYTTLVGVFATIPLDLVLIPRSGIVGAAIASSIAYSLSAAVVLTLYLRLRRISRVEAIDGIVVQPLKWLTAMWRQRGGALHSTQ